MRIAQVAPLKEKVPPPGYGGIELVVSHLTNQLVRRGHEVTLFASGDSQTLARLEAICPKALRLDPNVKEPLAYEIIQLSMVLERAQEFDIIHFHISFPALPFAELMPTPVVHTLHNGFTAESNRVFTKYSHQPYISISNAQRKHSPHLNYVATIYNAIDVDTHKFYPEPKNPPYLAFLGRISPEKGSHYAIEIAKRTGIPLRIAGKVDPVDRDFYNQVMVPLIDGKHIQYLGELSQTEKIDLVGNAIATLFPIDWEEPFGLVTIESMCTGTPVIATNRGSVPEIIVHEQTGFICNSIDEMAAKVPAAATLNRQACRDRVLERFSIDRMVNAYEAAYAEVIDEWKSRNDDACSDSLFV